MTEAVQHTRAPDPQSEPTSFRDQVLGVASYVAALRRANRRGPLAVMRRLKTGPHQIPPQVFWDITEKFQIRGRENEDFWLAVLPLMVRYPHGFDRTPGRALAAARVCAARVERWLRLDAAAARREAGRLLSHLKGEGLDWIKLAYLLRDWSDEQRRGFARDFFLSPEYRQRQTKGDS